MTGERTSRSAAPAFDADESTARASGGPVFSLQRWWAMVTKEFLQLRRDRVTFGMIVGIPIIQLTLFGYAINTDPKHMPTALIVADNSEFTRTVALCRRLSGPASGPS